MAPDVTVEWVLPADGAGDADGERVSARAQHALAEWAEARGLHVREARAEPLPVLRPNLALADTIEDELERAHDAITALDVAGAERALAKADAILHAAPELPSAAWLLAELERTRAARWARLPPHDAARAARAWARAATLDGGRAAGVGEETFARAPVQQPAPVTLSIVIDDARDGTAEGRVVRLDGAPRATGSAAAAPVPQGDHQLTVEVGGALVWAAWITVGMGRSDDARDAPVHVVLAPPQPCSRDDLRRARIVGGAPVASHVECGEWVLAREEVGMPTVLTLATCLGDQCGPTFRWSVGAFGPVVPPNRESRGHWPAWATWTIVGASAVAALAVTLAAAGVFRPTHDEPIFTTSPLHVSSTPVRPSPGD